MVSRRDFLIASGCAGAAGLVGMSAATRLLAADNTESLDLLILGGTGFLGPHVVRSAIDRGHRMTLFNRDRTNTHLFPELEKLKGDRDGKLDALQGRKWDAVVDTSGYVPRLVNDSASLLSAAVDQYLFISTVSVYADFSVAGMDETAPLGTVDDPSVEEITGETYGPLKALSEKAAEIAMPGRTTVIRPGLIVGPGDKTDRFTYWPVRIARGGEVLAPGDGTTYVQVIDVRDLANWIIHCIELRAVGIFNAISPEATLTMRDMLEGCQIAAASDSELVWVDSDFLEQQQVAPWSELPAWLPPEGDYAAFGQVSTARAREAGLQTRAINNTARDTLDWWNQLPAARRSKLRAGLSPQKEQRVLRAWHENLRPRV
ncbi:MAG: NAD-dependent epimerase/dehydratase family protein [Gammaproteobacteria bacterium]